MKKFIVLLSLACVAGVTPRNTTPKFVTVQPVQNGIGMAYYAPVGSRCVVQVSDDLVKWRSVETNVTTDYLSGFIDTNAVKCRFYRVKMEK